MKHARIHYDFSRVFDCVVVLRFLWDFDSFMSCAADSFSSQQLQKRARECFFPTLNFGNEVVGFLRGPARNSPARCAYESPSRSQGFAESPRKSGAPELIQCLFAALTDLIFGEEPGGPDAKCPGFLPRANRGSPSSPSY